MADIPHAPTPIALDDRPRTLWPSLRAVREIKDLTEGAVDLLARRFLGFTPENLPGIVAALLRHPHEGGDPSVTAEYIAEWIGVHNVTAVERAVFKSLGVDYDAFLAAMQAALDRMDKPAAPETGAGEDVDPPMATSPNLPSPPTS